VNATLSISDPAVAAWLVPGGLVDLGVVVSETSALGISAFYRAVSLISGQLASLPLPTYREATPREQVPSVFDDPDGPDGQTPYEWRESAFLHLLLHGRCGALKVRNVGGSLVRLPLVHPVSFRPELPTVDEYREGRVPAGGLWFDVTLDDGSQKRFDAEDFWYVPGLSLDGKTGVSLLTYARRSLATTISGDQAAGTMFSKGALISGLATPEDETIDISDDIPEIRRQLDRSVLGHEHAGAIAVVNRRLKFTPWSVSAVDAQFLQSRQFQIEEIARWTGVPPHLLMQTEKQTSWGTGVEMQDRALGRTVLGTWSTRFEQRASRLLARPRYVEFDFTRLERPSPDREIELDLSQVAAGVMTVDEYRAKRGWEPLPEPEPEPAGDPDGTPDEDDEEADDDPDAE
jgi:HK97 family phage portal protein